MPPVLGTAIVRVFDLIAGLTGLSAKAAAKAGLPCRSVWVEARDHAGYFPGAKPMVLKLLYNPRDGRVLGAQDVGAAGIDKRIDVIATALQLRGTVEDLSGLDLAYAPPFGSAKDPVHMAAFAALNQMAGLTDTIDPDADLASQQVLDVRTDAEYASGHDPRARHVPLDALRDRLGELDPAQPTVVMCRSGLRGHVATRILRQHGFATVRNLTGGYLMRRHARPLDTPPTIAPKTL
jgi:rhodanese-related sulfurtransferase